MIRRRLIGKQRPPKQYTSSYYYLWRILRSGVVVLVVFFLVLWRYSKSNGLQTTSSSSDIKSLLQQQPAPAVAQVLVSNTTSLDDENHEGVHHTTSNSKEHIQQQVQPEFQIMLERAKKNQLLACPDAINNTLLTNSTTTYSLEYLGIIRAIQDQSSIGDGNSNSSSTSSIVACQAPPTRACEELQLTVVFMGFHQKWLEKLERNIQHLLGWMSKDDSSLPFVKEIVLVWNNEASFLKEHGEPLLLLLDKHTRFRIVYSLDMGWGNSLFNRYHSKLNITTKAILYYDDDANIYEKPVVESAFELWKRNAHVQVGATGRFLKLKHYNNNDASQLHHQSSSSLQSFCPTTMMPLEYTTHKNFSQFSHVILPSGSLLHSNYLCFLSSPIFKELRESFVTQPPVFPDDLVVSFIIHELSSTIQSTARPLTYAKKLRSDNGTIIIWQVDRDYWEAKNKKNKKKKRRRLLSKQVTDWPKLRGEAATALALYFGAIPKPGYGWCHGTKYEVQQQDDTNTNSTYTMCESSSGVTMNMLPWLTTSCNSK